MSLYNPETRPAGILPRVINEKVDFLNQGKTQITIDDKCREVQLPVIQFWLMAENLKKEHNY